MQLSVESICNEMNRRGLLPSGAIRNARQQFLRMAGAAADAAMFGKWLAANRHITDYQAAVLLRRRDDPLSLGVYKVRDRIGRGRMAGVYKGVHPRGQVVAIKVLPPSRAADAQVLARFQREARLTLRLRHPNIIRTFEAGEERGTHYLVMEYLEGETLKDALLRRDGRLSPIEAMRLMYQALQALQHVHEQGMVHRDIEPGNLMLVPGGKGDETTLQSTLKLLDIGVGRALFDEGAPQGQFNITTAGDQLGTAEYSSPEQSRDARTVDVRSDLYSLGCVFYHVLVGQPPFVEKNVVRLLVRHATEKPAPLADFRCGEPPGLQSVLDGMLAKDPAMRFATPGHAAQELRRLMPG
jgi:eukaryotic-like serine/threonine-protein kinase